MRETQKENDELASKLAKRERECEAKAVEKVQFHENNKYEIIRRK